MRALAILSLSLLIHLPGQTAQARDETDPYEPYRPEIDRAELPFDDSGVLPWKESRTEVPALPGDDRLEPVDLDDLPPRLTLYLDPQGVRVDEGDGVTRYWVVLRSAQGAYNAMYEGVRCATHEYRTYAYGHPRRTPSVRLAAGGDWREIGRRARGRFRPELAAEILCAGISQKTPEQVADAIRGVYEQNNPFSEYRDH